MSIDFRVNPAFFEMIKSDDEHNKKRHEGFSIHKNSFAILDHIENQMHCANLDKLVLMSDDRRTEFEKPLVSNEEIKKCVDLSSGRFIGVASVDPLAKDAKDIVERAFKDLGLMGLKLNLSIAKIYPSDEKVQSLLEICEKYNKPVIFDSGFAWEKNSVAKYSRPIEFEETLIKWPNLKICLTQFGWPWMKETAMLMLKHQNLYTDTGLLYFDNAYEFYKQIFTKNIPLTWIDRSLRHQIMFASANPRFEQIRMSDAFSKLDLRASTKKLIMGENAKEFLGLRK